jgi:HMG-box domain
VSSYDFRFLHFSYHIYFFSWNSAKGDRKRYEDQMADYQPPDKQANRKRNKTGYNMFFSSHVLRLKQMDSGVPSERGSVARLVGSAWKLLAPEEKAYYESEADKHNGMHPVKDPDDDDDDDAADCVAEIKHRQQNHMEYQMPMPPHPSYGEMHMHGGMPPPAMHAVMGAPQHIPDAAMRHHHNPYYPPPPPPPHMYAHAHVQPPTPHPHPPYGHYDYSQHHQRHQARAQGGGYQPQGYPPGPSSRRPYEG